MPRVLVPLAAGCEELEAVTIVDLLRRAGIEVVTAGLQAGPIAASRGVVLVPDMPLDEALKQDFDAVVLPGGQPGATNLEQDTRVRGLLQRMANDGRTVAAICAAPKVLAAAGLLDGKRATCYRGAIEPAQFPKVKLESRAVVADGNIVTSRGPGTAMDFALELVLMLVGREARDRVEAGLLRPSEHALNQLGDWG